MESGPFFFAGIRAKKNQLSFSKIDFFPEEWYHNTNYVNLTERTFAMTRGFITIATGKEMYFQFARNLLLSYHVYCDAPLPFAILCDRENAYTALFDDVVLFEKTEHPYFDKFELLKIAPYDETIFIDSDCLAYGDLNQFWDYFAGADAFSASGTNYPMDSDRGLFRKEEIGPYTGRVHWKPDIHGGLYYIRKGETCDAIYRECRYIAEHYGDFRWPDYCAPFADEPVLCLAMASQGCHAQEAFPANYGIPWEVTEMKCDIFTGLCQYATDWHPLVNEGRMIHWSVRYCKKPLYRFEVEKLNLMVAKNIRPGNVNGKLSLTETLLYQYKLRYYAMLAAEFSGRVGNKILRILKIRK